MNKTMIRGDKKLVIGLKILKEKIGNSSYCEILKSLVHDKLMEDMAYTGKDYIAIGCVVSDEAGSTLVIEDVSNKVVTFHDGSSIFNGSVACSKLVKLGEDIMSYEEGVDV